MVKEMLPNTNRINKVIKCKFFSQFTSVLFGFSHQQYLVNFSSKYGLGITM